MDPSDLITLINAIASFALAAISFWALWSTLRQNKIMLENSTRPNIVAMYETFALPDGMIRYIVMKNFGQGAAKIQSIDCDGVKNQEFLTRLALLKGATIAPGQKVSYYFGPSDPGNFETLHIVLKYTSLSGHLYEDEISLNMTMGTSTMRSRKEEAIPMALQEIADRLL